MEKAPLKIDTTGKANGVYVITADGQLVDYTTEDPTALGVALITDNQKIMIEKMGEANTDIIKAAYIADGATDNEYTKFYWGSYGTDVEDIPNVANSSMVKQYFNGKAYTAAIIATPDSDTYTKYANMGTYCRLFNEASLGYSDWYVPATGQLNEINSNRSIINTALTNIGGTSFAWASYWSSSENNSGFGWGVKFGDDVLSTPNKCDGHLVRFVRDIN